MSTPKEPVDRLRIGWKELVDLPDLGLSRLKAKVDTGARTSSLHVEEMRVIEEHSDGTAEVELVLSPDRRHPDRVVRCRARRRDTIQVTDSGGHRHLRPVIETTLVLAGRRRRVRVTLADRSTMLFRMILGRKALEGAFVVDVAEKYLHGGPVRSMASRSGEPTETTEAPEPSPQPSRTPPTPGDGP